MFPQDCTTRDLVSWFERSLEQDLGRLCRRRCCPWAIPCGLQHETGQSVLCSTKRRRLDSLPAHKHAALCALLTWRQRDKDAADTCDACRPEGNCAMHVHLCWGSTQTWAGVEVDCEEVLLVIHAVNLIPCLSLGVVAGESLWVAENFWACLFCQCSNPCSPDFLMWHGSRRKKQQSHL